VRPAGAPPRARPRAGTAAWESREWPGGWMPAAAQGGARAAAGRVRVPPAELLPAPGARRFAASMPARRYGRCRVARSDPVREPRADAFQPVDQQPRRAGAGQAVEGAWVPHELRGNAPLAERP